MKVRVLQDVLGTVNGDDLTQVSAWWRVSSEKACALALACGARRTGRVCAASRSVAARSRARYRDGGRGAHRPRSATGTRRGGTALRRKAGR